LRRADYSSRGVLPTVVRLCAWSRNLMNEEAVAHWEGGLSRQKQTNVSRLQLTGLDLDWFVCLGAAENKHSFFHFDSSSQPFLALYLENVHVRIIVYVPKEEGLCKK